MWYFRLPPWKRTPEISAVFLLRGRAWRLRFYLIEAPESRPQRHSDQIDHVAQRCRMRFDSPVQRAPVPQRGFSKTFKWLLLLLIKCNLCRISNLIWGHTLVSFQLQITSSAICKIVFVQTMSAGDWAKRQFTPGRQSKCQSQCEKKTHQLPCQMQLYKSIIDVVHTSPFFYWTSHFQWFNSRIIDYLKWAGLRFLFLDCGRKIV